MCVQKLISEIRPHSLFTVEEFNSVSSMLQARNSSNIRTDPSRSMFPLPPEQLRKWKVLVMGRSHDFCKEPSSEHMQKKHKCVDQIMLDINRTFPGRLS